jgi:hypothetical protein
VARITKGRSQFICGPTGIKTLTGALAGSLLPPSAAVPPYEGRLANRAAAEKIDYREQDHRSEERNHESPYTEIALVDCAFAEKGRDQQATQERANDTNDDVQEYPLLRVGLHDEAREPTDNTADYQPNNKVHIRYSPIYGYPPSPPLPAMPFAMSMPLLPYDKTRSWIGSAANDV